MLGACASTPAPLPPLPAAPVRFLLTFDDGPSAMLDGNPTARVLDDLSANPLQPGVKALFFVQTRAAKAGGSLQGQALLRRQQHEGHLLGLHTADLDHRDHRAMHPEDLRRSLADGVADLTAVTGAAPRLVRPPSWHFNQRTFAAYQAHGLALLLADLNANDGKTWGIHGSLRRRSGLRTQLARVREEIAAGALPEVDGVIPVVAAFHDVNTYTARHLREYLQILLDTAREVGLTTAAPPFYDRRADLERAALHRAVSDGRRDARLRGIWHWLWQ